MEMPCIMLFGRQVPELTPSPQEVDDEPEVAPREPARPAAT